MTIAELDGLARQASQAGPSGRARVTVGIDVILRILAISVIVLQHATTFSIYGGAWTLLAVMGFSAARFQVQQIAAGHPLRLLARMLYPIIPLYYLLLVVYAVTRDTVPLSYWLLLGNYEPWTGGSLLVVYWFVSVYAQIVVVLALVAAIAPARRAVTADPWRAAAIAGGALLLVLVVLSVIQNTGAGLPYIPQRGLPECLSLFVVGWMLQRMEGVRRVVITALLAAAVLAALFTLDMTVQVLAVVVVALTVLGFHVALRVPRTWGRVLNQLAALTLYVYLIHQVVIYGLSRFGLPQLVVGILALVLSFVLAALAKRAVDALDRAVLKGRSRRPAEVPQESAVL